jgi:hypothetical protein
LASGNAASAKAGSVRECEALTIVRVKGLDFESNLFGLGEQDYATVCHRTVHIHQEQVDLRRALLQGTRNFRKIGHEASRVEILRV